MREFILTNLDTGEQHKFYQILDVEHFLCKTRAYIRACIKNGSNCYDKKMNGYDILSISQKKKPYNGKMQPCCTCVNATGGCEWADRFEPVPGWKATPTVLDCGAERVIKSYAIDECPKYRKG